eukprot:COSAG05_NODE_1416_length_4941_cov_5.527261_3_plen_58_part_01
MGGAEGGGTGGEVKGEERRGGRGGGGGAEGGALALYTTARYPWHMWCSSRRRRRLLFL